VTEPTKQAERFAVFGFGIFFVVVLLVLAMGFPNPTAFQYTVFRIVLSVAVAGTAAFLPGFMEARIRSGLRAGGAMAVFAIVYFFNPAGLVSDVADAPAPTDPFTIHLFESAPSGETLANRFTFPFSDISERASYSDFESVLRQLPGTDYSANTHKILRIRDELAIARNSAETAVSRGNTGVLVIPESILAMFSSEHEAFTYLLGFVRNVD
jgi:hypothetical protein